MKTLILILMIMLLFSTNVLVAGSASDLFKPVYNLDAIEKDDLDELVNNVLKESKVPGASIVLVSGDQTKHFSYGFENIEKGAYIRSDTLFELGSMSKAYTALGILLLEQKGLLSLDDPVSKYIPWLTVHFEGRYEGEKIDEDLDLKLSNLLYHTSGIPFKTIGNIPEGNEDNMLEKTVEGLTGIELDFYPGSQYQYATINYDVLALVIQNVTGQQFEEYMVKNILSPLGLHHTYMNRRDDAVLENIAQGYKLSFLGRRAYDSPVYRGNTAAGYFISDSTDIEKWMRMQLGLADIPLEFQELIERSHLGDITVASQGNYYYAGGWFVHIRGKEIKHGGENPSFSSMMILQPDKQVGICVLTNMNSNAASSIASNIRNMLERKPAEKYKTDLYQNIDTVFTFVTIVGLLLTGLFLVLFIIAIIEMVRKERKIEKMKGANVAGIICIVPLMLFCAYCVYALPNILMQRLPWQALKVWASPSIYIGCIIGYVALLVFMSYVVLTFNFPKQNEKNYMALVPLTALNGLTSALIIFTINESFNRNLEYSKELLVYFLFSVFFFVYSIKLVQGKMIVITNEMAYEKRIGIIDTIMCSSYQSIEKTGMERIFSGLTNDISAITQIPGIVIDFASNLMTLLFCLAYLLSKNVYAFVASFAIILISGALSLFTSKIATKYWEKNRDIQDTFFGQITDLIYGFKEIALNKLRCYAFWLDVKDYSKKSAVLNKEASIKVLNYSLYNALMYNLIFGVVVFIFPMINKNIIVNDLRENLFIVFYMVGPFNALASSIPRLSQAKVNLKRVDCLMEDLEMVQTESQSDLECNIQACPKQISLQLNDIVYKYNIKEEEKEEVEFILGPITAKFETGKITFITGGNGSGKSTLGKLITGLYEPLEGKIILNSSYDELNLVKNCFSAVYSDFHLFKKLYGIDIQEKSNEILQYLKKMKIEDKVDLDDSGEFRTLKLSTGQKKRLAFVVACLEDRPMMLFDEWAAEQDPEFRHYFYIELLPMLKAMGKGVIVITHDDRYFGTADQIIKLDRGHLLEETSNLF